MSFFGATSISSSTNNQYVMWEERIGPSSYRGTALNDASANARTLTVTGAPTSVASVTNFNQALTFDSSNYLSAGAISALSLTGLTTWTVEAIITVPSTSTNWIISGCFGTLSANQFWEFGIADATNNNKAFVSFRNAAGTQRTVFGTSTGLKDGAPHRIRGVLSGGSLMIYVDGTRENTLSVSTDVIRTYDSVTSTLIGRITATSLTYSSATWDEVRISANARSTGASYTVDTTPFTDDGANTLALYHLDSDGFVIDLTTTFSTLNSCVAMVKKGSRGTLTAVNFRYLFNTPANGKAAIVIQKHQYTRTSAISTITTGSQPSGVTIQAASGVNTSDESAHTHSINHDHAAFTTSAATNTGAGVNSALTTLNQNIGAHTHSVDIPNFTGTSAAGSAHHHADNNLYAHTHVDTYVDTNISTVEVTLGTDLSATSFYIMASGIRL